MSIQLIFWINKYINIFLQYSLAKILGFAILSPRSQHLFTDEINDVELVFLTSGASSHKLKKRNNQWFCAVNNATLNQYGADGMLVENLFNDRICKQAINSVNRTVILKNIYWYNVRMWAPKIFKFYKKHGVFLVIETQACSTKNFKRQFFLDNPSCYVQHLSSLTVIYQMAYFNKSLNIEIFGVSDLCTTTGSITVDACKKYIEHSKIVSWCHQQVQNVKTNPN